MMQAETKAWLSSEIGMNPERRKKPRINNPVFVLVRGSDACGKGYQFNTIARNIGSGGLCASTPRIMKVGEQISLHIRFARAGSNPVDAPRVSARAAVLRVEKLLNGSYLFAASFSLHRFV
jgi:hypothetical protein